MSLETRVVALTNAIGADIKDIYLKQGSLASLTTTAQTSLVAAINELDAALAAAGVQIDDLATNGATTVTWSADKIFDEIEAAKTAVTNSLVNGAAAALDTLNELATALGNDPNFATTVATALTNRVRVDAAQTFTGTGADACARTATGASQKERFRRTDDRHRDHRDPLPDELETVVAK